MENKQTYSVWLFIIHTQFIWEKQKIDTISKELKTLGKFFPRPKKARDWNKQLWDAASDKERGKIIQKTKPMPHMQRRTQGHL